MSSRLKKFEKNLKFFFFLIRNYRDVRETEINLQRKVFYLKIWNSNLSIFCFAFTVRRELLESLVPLKKKRRRSLSQLTPAETLGQFLLNLPSHAASQVAVANKLNNNDSEERMKNGVNVTSGLLFGTTPSQSHSLGAPPPTSNTTHGTSAGFCNICQKFVSNRTNHKYVHSQVSSLSFE